MTTPPAHSSRTADHFAQEDPSKWREPSQAQRLSNRVILRAQQLANELKDDLNTLSFFKDAAEKAGEPESVESVVFVCPDPETTGTKPNYFPRLLNTFNLEEVGLWGWIVKHKKRFNPLFELHGDDAGYKSFLEVVERAETAAKAGTTKAKRLRAVVHDLLIDQIAKLPYRGLLPELWEDFFWGSLQAGTSPKPPLACWCHVGEPPETANGGSPDRNHSPVQPVEIWRFDELRRVEEERESKSPPPLPAVEISASDAHLKERLNELYRDFVDPFLLAIHTPLKDTNYDSPYFERHQYGDVRGIALPVYDWFPREGLEPRGAFLAWLFIIPKQNEAVFEAIFPEEPPEASKSHNSWLGLSFCVRKFASRLRQLQRREALEHRGTRGGGALELTKELSHCFTGWRRSMIEWEPDFSSDENEGKFFVYKRHGDTHQLAIDASPTLGLGLDERGAPLPVFLERLPGTIVPENPKAREDYLLHQAEAVRAFYRDAARLEAERRFGKLLGELSSAHDYSKDIGSACLKMREFNKSLEQTATAILEQSGRLAELPEPAPGIGAAITGELNRIEVPRMDWFASVQFAHAHLRTQTIGPIQDEPAECVAMIETGTLRSIYELVWTLVWHRQQAESLPTASAEKLSNPLTWAALFRYDMEPTEATMPFHEKLGRRIQEMVREQKMTGTDFLNRFPVPEINPGSRDFDAPLLWGPGDKERWECYKPIERLLPLLVFSLRFAFQCAWAKTLLEGHSGQREPVRLSADSPVGRTRRIEIAFAAPDSDHRGRLEGIPYFMEWRRQMGHYTGRTYPWKDVGTDSVTLDQRTNIIFLSLTASV